ncbi:MAG: hypothetical protein PHI96_05845 [Desulfovibrio sp.]|nr:hypothetical protein [Desulfovibrio sp.]
MLNYRLFKEINDLFASGQYRKARHLLMEVQSRCIALRDEISLLQVRLKTLEDAAVLKENLEAKDGFYWLFTDTLRQGPFCPHCYESEGGLIRLERSHKALQCPYCHATYAVMANEEYQEGSAVRHARIIPFAR